MELLTPLVLALILLPLLGALLLRILKGEAVLLFITRLFSCAVIIFSVVVGIYMLQQGNAKLMLDASMMTGISYFMLCVEWIIAIFLIVVGIKNRKRLVALFAFLGVSAMTWFEFSGIVHHVQESAPAPAFYIDNLAIIMVLIVGVIGGLICLFSAGYMKDYHHHHKEYQNKMSMFFSTLFLFLSAMFGLVLANDLIWLLFFWEITTLSSFLLIGYTKTTEATNNAFRAAVINLGGGLAFVFAIIFMGWQLNVLDLQGMLALGSSVPYIAIPVFLFCFAGMTKAAQMPFATWLLGAMVAPTPTSALLHSSTMVKAGVYIIIRMCPLLLGTTVGIIVAVAGAFTFLCTAILAISQSDAKRVLAYSTISNLGLIVMCAGIATPEAVWAAIMIVIFHAVAKSLLFLSVGSTEHRVGSRDLESLDSGIRISRPLALCLMIGIAGMFLAPFGMLISKWAAMRAVMDSPTLLIILIIAFGSAVTLFFWTKWLGKVIANFPRPGDEKYKQHKDEGISLFLHAVLTVACCVGFPLISSYLINPFVGATVQSIGDYSTLILIFMVVLLFIVPLLLLPNRNKHKSSTMYLAGENLGDDGSFRGGLGATQKVDFRNWYITKFFGEGVLFNKTTFVAALIVTVGAALVLTMEVLQYVVV